MQQKILHEVQRHVRSGRLDWLLKQTYNVARIYMGGQIGRPLTGPLLAGLMVTYRCNLDCPFCDYPARGDIRRELTTEDFKDVLRELKALGVPAVGFAGGDPVLRKDIWELVREAVDLGFTTSLGSNGTFWRDETVERALNSGLHLMGFSLESTEPELHDHLQGQKGAWEKVCNTIRKVDAYRKQHGKEIIISVSINFNFQNLDTLLNMPAFAKSLGADQVNFIGMETGGIEHKGQDVVESLQLKNVDLEKIDRIVDQLIELKKKTPLIDNSFDSLKALKYQARQKALPVKCYAGYTSIYIDCYGRYFSCMAFMEKEKPAGKYEKGKLKDFWYSRDYNRYRKENLDDCRSCYWPCQNEMNYLLNTRRYIPGLPLYQEQLV